MSAEPPFILIDAHAWDQMVVAAARDTELETGGILLGWREKRGLHVAQVLEVPDRGARRTSYVRRQQLAESMLDEILEVLPKVTSIGYVGEWHVHPLPIGPSPADRREIKRFSKKTDGALGLVVCARETHEDVWRPHGLVGIDGDVLHADVRIEEVATNGSE